METNTAKNFALQLGALVSLYVSLTSLLVLLFGVVDISFPDDLDSIYAYESAQNSIRFSIATLIVFFPSYVVLTRLVNNIRRKESGTYLGLTKWLIYLSLLVGGAVLLGDLVTVINTFLNGEITSRFVLKALSVLIVIGSAFYYYMLDARGHWIEHEKQSVRYGALAILIALGSLVFGFMNIETPETVREMRFDDDQVSDLQDMQFRIEEYYRLNTKLPETVEELYVGTPVPEAPDGRQSYAYAINDAESYELCATFSHATQESMTTSARLVFEKGFYSYSWDHPEGEYCFMRKVESLTE